MALKKRLTNLGSLMKKPTASDPSFSPDADTPEANAQRGVIAFCESGAANSGEEVLHLPTIVESAVASPEAARAAAVQIRKFLSKENYGKPHVQYNAVMLIRILADNPGQSFTKNLDKQFADTIKHLLRNGQDPSVAQILRETLDAMEREKAYDTNLNVLFIMWRKEKGLMANAQKQFGPRTLHAPAWNGQQIQGGFSQNGRSSRSLPPPIELAGRIEEARTSAKLLLQLVQSTPANELMGNDLVKEFSERCMAAQRSIQGYINCDNPGPDDDTMLTLIETNEQLSLAASKHQRAVLQARRFQGQSPSPPISNQQQPPAAAPASYTPAVNSYTPPANNQPPSSTTAPGDGGYSLPAGVTFTQNSRDNNGPLVSPLNNGAQSPTHKYDKDELPLPPSLQAGGMNHRNSRSPPATQEEDNPFADSYAAPTGPPPNRGGPTVATDNVDSPSSEYTTQNQSRGSPTSYHPGYQSTPSYMNRQESSANNLTMHGAAQQSSDAGNYGVSNDRPATPDRSGHAHQRSEVSPIAERTTVTYRY